MIRPMVRPFSFPRRSSARIQSLNMRSPVGPSLMSSPPAPRTLAGCSCGKAAMSIVLCCLATQSALIPVLTVNTAKTRCVSVKVVQAACPEASLVTSTVW